MEATFDLETMTDEEVIDLLGGDLDRLHRLIDDAQKRDAAFDAVRDDLTKEFPNRWIAWVQGGPVATADSLDSVYAKVDAEGLKRDSVVVEFLDPNPPILRL